MRSSRKPLWGCGSPGSRLQLPAQPWLMAWLTAGASHPHHQHDGQPCHPPASRRGHTRRQAGSSCARPRALCSGVCCTSCAPCSRTLAREAGGRSAARARHWCGGPAHAQRPLCARSCMRGGWRQASGWRQDACACRRLGEQPPWDGARRVSMGADRAMRGGRLGTRRRPDVWGQWRAAVCTHAAGAPLWRPCARCAAHTHGMPASAPAAALASAGAASGWLCMVWPRSPRVGGVMQWPGMICSHTCTRRLTVPARSAPPGATQQLAAARAAGCQHCTLLCARWPSGGGARAGGEAVGAPGLSKDARRRTP
jgi:hypothetical protein